jgi:hypothetical protein
VPGKMQHSRVFGGPLPPHDYFLGVGASSQLLYKKPSPLTRNGKTKARPGCVRKLQGRQGRELSTVPRKRA